MAIRVPVPDGSVTDVVAQLERSTSAQEINARLREAATRPPLRGILAVSDDELVSVDIIGNPHSSIVDAPSTMVLGAPWPRCWPGMITSGATPVVWPSWRGG